MEDYSVYQEASGQDGILEYRTKHTGFLQPTNQHKTIVDLVVRSYLITLNVQNAELKTRNVKFFYD